MKIELQRLVSMIWWGIVDMAMLMGSCQLLLSRVEFKAILERCEVALNYVECRGVVKHYGQWSICEIA